MDKAEFVNRRTEIISQLLDNEDEFGIYPTTRCFARLDDLFDEINSTCWDEKEPEQPSWAQKNWFWDDT